MLACARLSVRLSAPAAARACLRAAPARCYGSSVYDSAASSQGGYSAYSAVQPAAAYEEAWPVEDATADAWNDAPAPLECMNRNARKPSKANHGARPNSSYNRKRSSPEFGSWKHVGLKPGQNPPPRVQPGTPSCVAEVATITTRAGQNNETETNTQTQANADASKGKQTQAKQ